jgi:hypothetical protein
MFGIHYIKFNSMTHVIHYKKGRVRKLGKGLSFYYYAPNSSIVAIPVGSKDVQFIFNNSTVDFQLVSIQGQITYRIEDPGRISELLDFTVGSSGAYTSDDPGKLDARLVNEAQTATSSFIQGLALKDVLRKAKEIEDEIAKGLTGSHAVKLLGVAPIRVNVIAVKPTPEMGKALETTTREDLQKEADLAIYKRRQFAVEQEKTIKESELDIEIAVEQKKKQIAEKRMETEVIEEENRKHLREIKIDADIAIEEQRKRLIDTQTENNRREADAQGYMIRATLDPYKGLDWKTILALTQGASDPKNNLAIAFRELAEKAEKISNLTITPDLLANLVQTQARTK